MLTSARYALAAITLSAAAIAGAAPAPAPAAGAAASEALVTVQTIAGALGRPVGAEAAGLAGTYTLSNGDTMRISYVQRHLFVEQGAHTSELLQTGSNSYVARGSDMQLRFEPLPFATDVLVSGR